ncbi:Rha family transcriptional regulator [Sebaldella sp. S0638]|uniref:Rha family transcriptional regulator n=1 Tax=Sebaldella sp. S0638 TaxID=2957809 RepID=UPI0020A145F8|nr:Rha family transcriptional regulator [Sebaldella sp. S0638]MCP1226000.1 Rha family transcriptional regulator [Sebaldella sp. S0638]
MNNLVVMKHNGILVVDSREAAKVLGVRHSDLLRDIEKYIVTFENSENAILRSQDFFIESSYTTDGNSKDYKNYLVTEKGCEFISHKRTGQKGILFTATYINGFHAMKDALRNPVVGLLPQSYPEALRALAVEVEAKEKLMLENKELEIQLDRSQEYYSIKRVAILNGVDWRVFSWRDLKEASEDIGVPVKKIPDANYLNVNVYHHSAWGAVYPEYELD